jgi:hypothetical protein
MTTSTRRVLVTAAAVVTVAAALLAALPGGIELRITPVRGEAPLLVLPLIPDERFTLHYYHSVENAPIWETHSVDAHGRIYIEEERYLKFGAGMGKMPGVGRMEMRGPYEVITEMHRPVGDFVLRIGSPGVDHTIIWRGRQLNLSAVAPHVAAQFTARPVSRLYALWRRVFAQPGTARMVPEKK